MSFNRSVSICPVCTRARPATAGACGWRRLLVRGLLALGLQAGVWAAVPWEADRMAQAALAHGPKAQAGLNALRPLLERAAAQDDIGRLQAVNEFFNRRIAFRDDAAVWGQIDHWASPLEMLGKGEGDCEDYAVAKYFSLLAVGVSAHKLRLVYVRAQMGGPGGPVRAHMVLAYYATPAAEPLILDNLLGDVRAASRRPDLTPVFSFNGDGLWQGTGAQAAGDPLSRLSRWREVLAKARAEGFLP